MRLECSWWLLLPALLSICYGYTQFRTMAALHLPARQVRASWPAATLAAAALTLGWSAGAVPLPVLYIVLYLFQAARLLADRPVRMKNWFMLNLSYANELSLHLILIGVAALIQETTMHALLEDLFWRTVTISAVLLVVLLQDVCFLLRPDFARLFSAEAESEEARPFMAFLWFCAAYLLSDSTLCVFELEPLYPPLFLVGSSAVVLFTLIRFLLHINALIKNNHLKEEYDRLASRLEAAEESAGTLRQLAERDVLTGVLSRRFIMERINALIWAQTPFSLAFLDLDALKRVNDTRGHDAGDTYLIRFTKMLGDQLRDGDLLARVGGDEFIVLMPGCAEAAAERRIREIRDILEREGGGVSTFRFSFGVAAFSEGGEDAEHLLREADRAMYRDKLRRHQEGGGV